MHAESKCLYKYEKLSFEECLMLILVSSLLIIADKLPQGLICFYETSTLQLVLHV